MPEEPPPGSPQRPRWAGFLGASLLTVAVGVAIVVMAGNPLHLKHFPWIFVALVAVTTGSATLTALLIPAGWLLRAAVAGVCAVVGGAFTAILGFGAVAFNSPGRVDLRVDSPDGRYALESVQGRAFTAIDPQYEVLLVSGTGLLAREALVWRGLEEGAVPTALRFTGPDEIELVTDAGCIYRSHFSGTSLTVQPVWTETQVRGGCASPH